MDLLNKYYHSKNKRFSSFKATLLNSEQWSEDCLSLPLFKKLRIIDARKTIKEVKKYFKPK